MASLGITHLGSMARWTLDSERTSVGSITMELRASFYRLVIWTLTFLTLRGRFALSPPRQVAHHCRFRAQVDRGATVIEADEWPAFLYDEDRINPKKEWVGLFLGETFVRVS